MNDHKYFCLKQQIFSYQNYVIVPFRKKDLFLVREWRNKQINVLRQKKILTDEDQHSYYNKYILPSFNQPTPNIILFSFLKEDTCIGYGGLTNTDWESKRVELSFLVDIAIYENKDLYQTSFSAFIKLVKQVVFEDLGFNRIFAETYNIRPHHISILESNGFIFEGRMRQHVIIDEKYVDSLLHGFIKEQYV